MKDKAIHHLSRVVRDLERAAVVNHDALLKAGVPYEARKRAQADADVHKEAATALRWALERLKEVG